MDINDNLKSQYAAAFAMLHQAVEKCPAALWTDAACGNPFWMVAYHILFYTHLYAHPRLEDFKPWVKCRRGPERFQPGGEPYSKAEILEFWDLCSAQIGPLVDAAALDAESGFHWLPFNRLEAHMYNIRHLQHHVGELCERLGVVTHVEVGWVIKTN